MLNNLSIKKKMIYWNIFILILFSISLIFIGNDSINRLMNEKRTQIKNLSDSFASVIFEYVKLEKDGKISHDEAVSKVKMILNAARYDGDNYYFVGDYDRRQIVNPKRPKDDGVIQNSPQYHKFVEISLKNNGPEFLSYYTSKPGFTGEFPKLTYLVPIPEWKWYIGTGIYIDDVDRQKSKNIMVIGIITFIITIFLMFGGVKIANFISVPLSLLTNLLKKSSLKMNEESTQLTKMSEEVGKSSREQASSIQETAAAISEVTSMISRTSTLTLNSENLSKTINIQTELGNRAVKDMVESMESIQEASKKLTEIEAIITQIENKAVVINDIVTKTELLSLNASIESARAGEYGKGFAVVAEEVGNLAKTSGKSSKEISELLEKSRENVKNILELTLSRVSEGQHKTEEVSNIFNKIIKDVNDIQIQMSQISEATREQEIGLKQISEAMTKIDISAINNLKSAEKSVLSSSKILEISHDLKSITSKTEDIVFGEKKA
ncbi:methyl-accepting chemotaxis protein [Fluviispira vulneris]|uniref:methyl-accepting chemotaxis protein n=1 Tax=Fluviispira vulneris TaxID=2763012 RepID=UPI00164486BC|nr:methyl-accepting chemotaxis protein [Fluviispira vulneris]